MLGDPAQLQQKVIINLCNNAAQALEKPGLIAVRCQARDYLSVARRCALI